MWGLLVHGEMVREPLLGIGVQLPVPTAELSAEAFDPVGLSPLPAEPSGSPDQEDVLGYSRFYSSTSGKPLLAPVTDGALSRAREVATDLLEGLDGVVLWGNAFWMPRLVNQCAREMHTPVLYVEQGWFRDPEGNPTHIVDPVGVYTQGPCLIDREWADHAAEVARAEEFIAHYRSSRQTKHEIAGTTRLKVFLKRLFGGRCQPSTGVRKIEVELSARGAKCLFVAGQVAEDSAQYWGDHLCSDVEELCAGALENLPADWLMVVKPHPFDYLFGAAAARRFAPDPRCIWAADGDIHDLIDLADAVLTINSNVGLEASVYDRPVLLAGRAVYGDRGFTTRLSGFEDLPALLRDLSAPDHTRLIQFLDYVTAVYLIRSGPEAADELARRIEIAVEDA